MQLHYQYDVIMTSSSWDIDVGRSIWLQLVAVELLLKEAVLGFMRICAVRKNDHKKCLSRLNGFQANNLSMFRLVWNWSSNYFTIFLISGDSNMNGNMLFCYRNFFWNIFDQKFFRKFVSTISNHKIFFIS